MSKLLAVLEADAKEVGAVALAAFVGAFTLAPSHALKDVLVAAVVAAVRAGVGEVAVLLSKSSTTPVTPGV